MRTKGKIRAWNDDKGYGFIEPLAGGKQLFLHVSALSNRNRRPVVNEVVTYSVSKDKQGRPCAANATLAGDKLVPKASHRPGKVSLLFAALFLGAVAVSVMSGQFPVALLIAYSVMSLLTFVAYAFDKSAAKRGAWRTSESTLLVLGLLCGWPGALFAQETLRHKSRKSSFQAAYWLTVLINCAAFAWLFTDDGRAALQGLIA